MLLKLFGNGNPVELEVLYNTCYNIVCLLKIILSCFYLNIEAKLGFKILILSGG